jgi:hypothetical protein
LRWPGRSRGSAISPRSPHAPITSSMLSRDCDERREQRR